VRLRNIRLFVRLGALKRFDALKKKTVELPVSVEWDRRRAERRHRQAEAQEKRQTDRRQNPPFTWEVADFVVAESDEGGD
jgi:hypothetical protein